MSDHKLTYYYHNASMCCTHISLLLKYHKVENITLKCVDIINREQMKPEYLALNPQHTVPVLVDETVDVVLSESAAIVQYLAKLFNWEGKYGVPSSEKQQALVLNAFSAFPYSIRSPTGRIYRTFYPAFKGQQPELLDVNDMKEGLEAIKADHFPLINDTLKKNNGWFTGEPTIFDAFAAFELLKYTTHPAGMALYDFEDFPEIKAWIDRVMADISEEETLAPAKLVVQYAKQFFNESFCFALHPKAE